MSDAGLAPVARLAGVGLRYRQVQALADIDLDVPAGCMVGVIGPDGVGKSSLLALMAGARVVQQGRVQVLGGDMARAGRPGALAGRSPSRCPQSRPGSG